MHLPLTKKQQEISAKTKNQVTVKRLHISPTVTLTGQTPLRLLNLGLFFRTT